MDKVDKRQRQIFEDEIEKDVSDAIKALRKAAQKKAKRK